jgi:hypothetical protein
VRLLVAADRTARKHPATAVRAGRAGPLAGVPGCRACQLLTSRGSAHGAGWLPTFRIGPAFVFEQVRNLDPPSALRVATSRALAGTGAPPCIRPGAGLRRSVRIAPVGAKALRTPMCDAGRQVGADDHGRPGCWVGRGAVVDPPPNAGTALLFARLNGSAEGLRAGVSSHAGACSKSELDFRFNEMLASAGGCEHPPRGRRSRCRSNVVIARVEA